MSGREKATAREESYWGTDCALPASRLLSGGDSSSARIPRFDCSEDATPPRQLSGGDSPSTLILRAESSKFSTNFAMDSERSLMAYGGYSDRKKMCFGSKNTHEASLSPPGSSQRPSADTMRGLEETEPDQIDGDWFGCERAIAKLQETPKDEEEEALRRKSGAASRLGEDERENRVDKCTGEITARREATDGLEEQESSGRPQDGPISIDAVEDPSQVGVSRWHGAAEAARVEFQRQALHVMNVLLEKVTRTFVGKRSIEAAFEDMPQQRKLESPEVDDPQSSLDTDIVHRPNSGAVSAPKGGLKEGLLQLRLTPKDLQWTDKELLTMFTWFEAVVIDNFPTQKSVLESVERLNSYLFHFVALPSEVALQMLTLRLSLQAMRDACGKQDGIEDAAESSWELELETDQGILTAWDIHEILQAREDDARLVRLDLLFALFKTVMRTAGKVHAEKRQREYVEEYVANIATTKAGMMQRQSAFRDGRRLGFSFVQESMDEDPLDKRGPSLDTSIIWGSEEVVDSLEPLEEKQPHQDAPLLNGFAESPESEDLSSMLHIAGQFHDFMLPPPSSQENFEAELLGLFERSLVYFPLYRDAQINSLPTGKVPLDQLNPLQFQEPNALSHLPRRGTKRSPEPGDLQGLQISSDQTQCDVQKFGGSPMQNDLMNICSVDQSTKAVLDRQPSLGRKRQKVLPKCAREQPPTEEQLNIPENNDCVEKIAYEMLLLNHLDVITVSEERGCGFESLALLAQSSPLEIGEQGTTSLLDQGIDIVCRCIEDPNIVKVFTKECIAEMRSEIRKWVVGGRAPWLLDSMILAFALKFNQKVGVIDAAINCTQLQQLGGCPLVLTYPPEGFHPSFEGLYHGTSCFTANQFVQQRFSQLDWVLIRTGSGLESGTPRNSLEASRPGPLGATHHVRPCRRWGLRDLLLTDRLAIIDENCTFSYDPWKVRRGTGGKDQARVSGICTALAKQISPNAALLAGAFLTKGRVSTLDAVGFRPMRAGKLMKRDRLMNQELRKAFINYRAKTLKLLEEAYGNRYELEKKREKIYSIVETEETDTEVLKEQVLHEMVNIFRRCKESPRTAALTDSHQCSDESENTEKETDGETSDDPFLHEELIKIVPHRQVSPSTLSDATDLVDSHRSPTAAPIESVSIFANAMPANGDKSGTKFNETSKWIGSKEFYL